MKFISLFTRLGLLALGFILVAAVNDDNVWSNPSTDQPTTSGLADALLNEWGFALLVLGVLMAMAMMVMHVHDMFHKLGYDIFIISRTKSMEHINVRRVVP